MGAKLTIYKIPIIIICVVVTSLIEIILIAMKLQVSGENGPSLYIWTVSALVRVGYTTDQGNRLWFEHFKRKTIHQRKMIDEINKLDTVRGRVTIKLVIIALVSIINSVLGKLIVKPELINQMEKGEEILIYEIMFGSIVIGITLLFTYLAARSYDLKMKKKNYKYRI